MSYNLPLLQTRAVKSKPYKNKSNIARSKKNEKTEHELLLVFHDDLIELYDCILGTTLSIDFLQGSLVHRHQFGGGRGQAIAKAVGLKSGATPSILDTTAGMAGDAFVLATLGCPVKMIERSPIIFTLIENAIERASLNETFSMFLQQGFSVINNDSKSYISNQLLHKDNLEKDTATNTEPPDVIYIDPMYPERKKSALVKKDMQVLQRLHGRDEDAEQLLELALQYAKKRVVVKRPIHAHSLNDRAPNTEIKSKKTRYDIYTISKI